MQVTQEELDSFNALCNEANSKPKVFVTNTPAGEMLAPKKEDWDEVNDYIARLGIKYGFDSDTRSIDSETGEIIPRW